MRKDIEKNKMTNLRKGKIEMKEECKEKVKEMIKDLDSNGKEWEGKINNVK